MPACRPNLFRHRFEINVIERTLFRPDAIEVVLFPPGADVKVKVKYRLFRCCTFRDLRHAHCEPRREQQVIQAMKDSNKKYAKPFEKGKMSTFSIMGGNWEEYAAIVMDMVTADTLLEVDEKLERLNSNIERLIAALER